MVFLPHEQLLLAFSNCCSPSTSDYLTEVWAWNGTTWRPYDTDLPAQLGSASMAYDTDHDFAVLHTGALRGTPGGTWLTG